MGGDDPLVLEFLVACSTAHAFEVWTTRAATWWPADHTMSGADGVAVVFEPAAGGRIYERAPDGSEHEWGRVSAWDPPHRVAYSWYFGGGPAAPTVVEVTFRAEADGTRVCLRHAGWGQFGDQAVARRDRNQQGWSDVVPLYQHTAASFRAPP